MINLSEITSQFPEYVHADKLGMVREYLQYKILEIVFNHEVSSKLVFIGGTALRIAYNTQRFSEDLDFDNKGLTLEDWNQFGEDLLRTIRLELPNAEIDSRVNKTVFHHDLKFPGLLHDYGLTGHKNQKLLIKMDSENQGIDYKYELMTINKFGIQTKVKVMPLDVALSQKIRALMDREMGRDLFDISSISSRTKPNYDYLKQTLNIDNPKDLKEKILERCEELDFTTLEHRATTFLFKKNEANKIRDFRDFVKDHEF